MARAIGKLERFIIFGSYVTGKESPVDVDVFMVVAPDLSIDDYEGPTRMLVSHAQADRDFGASIFWAHAGISSVVLSSLIEG